jgi:hypothetical protein
VIEPMHGGVEFPRSSGFKLVFRRRSFGSSFVKVLRLAPGSKGPPTMNNFMGPDDGYDNKYIPH